MLCIKNGDDDKYKNGDDDEYKNGDDDDEYKKDNFNKSKQTFIRDPVLVYLMQLLKKLITLNWRRYTYLYCICICIFVWYDDFNPT